VQRFTDLRVWKRSHALVLKVYQLTRRFPPDERFGLVGQLRRAILSVPTNIAEGSKRIGRQEYARFLNIAEGSLAEVEYLLMVTCDLNYAPRDGVQPLLDEADEIARMLTRLRESVERSEKIAKQRN
jgi:four helix bundle protein